jgi:hypothetical protein
MTTIRMTLSDIIGNALDKNYSMEQDGAGLGDLMLDRELKQIISIQQPLAFGKLREDGIYERHDVLGIRLERT